MVRACQSLSRLCKHNHEGVNGERGKWRAHMTWIDYVWVRHQEMDRHDRSGDTQDIKHNRPELKNITLAASHAYRLQITAPATDRVIGNRPSMIHRNTLNGRHILSFFIKTVVGTINVSFYSRLLSVLVTKIYLQWPKLTKPDRFYQFYVLILNY